MIKCFKMNIDTDENMFKHFSSDFSPIFIITSQHLKKNIGRIVVYKTKKIFKKKLMELYKCRENV